MSLAISAAQSLVISITISIGQIDSAVFLPRVVNTIPRGLNSFPVVIARPSLARLWNTWLTPRPTGAYPHPQSGLPLFSYSWAFLSILICAAVNFVFMPPPYANRLQHARTFLSVLIRIIESPVWVGEAGEVIAGGLTGFFSPLGPRRQE